MSLLLPLLVVAHDHTKRVVRVGIDAIDDAAQQRSLGTARQLDRRRGALALTVDAETQLCDQCRPFGAIAGLVLEVAQQLGLDPAQDRGAHVGGLVERQLRAFGCSLGPAHLLVQQQLSRIERVARERPLEPREHPLEHDVNQLPAHHRIGVWSGSSRFGASWLSTSQRTGHEANRSSALAETISR